MGVIVGIGGGRMTDLETLTIDKEIVSFTGLESPNALYIPTASYDSPEKWDEFRGIYGDKLGCNTDVLYLLGETPSYDELTSKILSAHIIYVAGGNTLKMMMRWRLLGVDKILDKAFESGTVLSGTSAGMLCWFKFGHSDSRSFYGRENWNYIKVRGLGYINAIGCPHYNSESEGAALGALRSNDFKKMIRSKQDIGIAVDNHAAFMVVDNKYKVLSSKSGSGVYRLRKLNNEIVEEKLDQTNSLQDIATLIN